MSKRHANEQQGFAQQVPEDSVGASLFGETILLQQDTSLRLRVLGTNGPRIKVPDAAHIQRISKAEQWGVRPSAMKIVRQRITAAGDGLGGKDLFVNHAFDEALKSNAPNQIFADDDRYSVVCGVMAQSPDLAAIVLTGLPQMRRQRCIRAGCHGFSVAVY